MRNKFILLASLALLMACSAPEDEPAAASNKDASQADRSVSAEQAQIEAALVPLVNFTGEEDRRPALRDRMEELAVPHASVAVIRDGELDWAAAYGKGADTETQFQAASLSKLVAAVGIVALAAERGISLDDDISADLQGIDLAMVNPEGLPITLRGLLSHTNGATVHGFPGYPAGEDIPSTADVIMGRGNTDMVVIKPNPDGAYSYSGGGYTIAQLWAESVTGETFAVLMDRLVLDPVGMEQSTFAMLQPGDPEAAAVIPAHDWYGGVIESQWHVYPESAAAGLWTTASDYAQFVSALMRADGGEAGTGIDLAVADEVLMPVSEEYGLGIGIEKREGNTRLIHSGSNEGYRSNFLAFPASGDAIAIMTNAPNGFRLLGDINRAANIAYDWPSLPLTTYDRVAVTATDLEPLAGDYTAPDGQEVLFTLTVQEQSGDLVLHGDTPGWYKFDLVKIGPDRFVEPQEGMEGIFTTTEDGTINATLGGQPYRRVND